jgi:enediyne biosynthesis protein E4
MMRHELSWILPVLALMSNICCASPRISFSDVSSSAGFDPDFLANIPAGGIAVADFNGNGFPDIFVTGYFQPNRLYFNQGDGTFVQNPAINADIAAEQCSVVAAADFDNDGWPDLYVGCRNRSNLLLRNLAGQGFENVMQPALDHAPSGANSPRTDAVAWADLTGNGHLDLFIGVYPSSANPDLGNPDNLDRIVLNHGNGQWSEIAGAFLTADRAHLARTALAVTLTDLNLNGRPDIYVVNDKLQGNTLWRNDGPGCGGWCFSEQATAVGLARPVFGMGIAVGDVDRDGRWDLYFSSIDEQVLMRGTGTAPLAFEEDASSPLNHTAVGWGTIFADFDNDGWEDAFLAVNSGSFSTSSTVDQVFRNDGDGSFTRITRGTGLDTIRPTEAAALIDFDLDGRLDLILGHWNEATGYRLYRNVSETTGQWIGFRLSGGSYVNRDAIGTRIVINDGGNRPQMRQLRSGDSRGSSHHPVVHFGLGDQTQVDVVIHWPDGLVQTISNLASGKYHVLEHPGQTTVFHDRFESE